MRRNHLHPKLLSPDPLGMLSDNATSRPAADKNTRACFDWFFIAFLGLSTVALSVIAVSLIVMASMASEEVSTLIQKTEVLEAALPRVVAAESRPYGGHLGFFFPKNAKEKSQRDKLLERSRIALLDLDGANELLSDNERLFLQAFGENVAAVTQVISLGHATLQPMPELTAQVYNITQRVSQVKEIEHIDDIIVAFSYLLEELQDFVVGLASGNQSLHIELKK